MCAAPSKGYFLKLITGYVPLIGCGFSLYVSPCNSLQKEDVMRGVSKGNKNLC